MTRLILIAALALLAGSVLAHAYRPASEPVFEKPRFQVRGDVDGLYPGERRDLRVRINNRTRRDVMAGRLWIEVGPGAPGCGPEFLRITGPRKVKKRISDHGRRGITLHAKMHADAPDACREARFPLHYRVRLRR